MINTYQTSLAPPPVPPRLSRSTPVLIPTPLPLQGRSKALIRFLVGVVLLHLFLSVAGFIYLYHINNTGKLLTADGKVAYLSSEKQETSDKTMASMVVEHPPDPRLQTFTPGYLQWDMKHSFRRAINYYHKNWLTILQSGDYYVYSRVTFSKSDSQHPLVSRVKLRKNEKEKEKNVMQAYCNLYNHSESALIPRQCTASQGEVMRLEKGNQLSVWVQDLSMVDYEDGATTFGMYKL